MPNKEYNITHTQMGGGELKEDLGGGSSVLTPATADTLGGVKIGTGISVTEDGTISAEGGSGEGSEPGPLVMVSMAAGTTVGDTTIIDIPEDQVSIENPPVIYIADMGHALTPCKAIYEDEDESYTYVAYAPITVPAPMASGTITKLYSIFIANDNGASGFITASAGNHVYIKTLNLTSE